MRNLPQGIKTLLLINGGMFVLTFLLQATSGINLEHILGMYYFQSPNYHHYQIITHMFMHGGFWHLFFNMYSLFLLGTMIERVWGTKRFIFYYIFTGLGAAALHTGVNWWQIHGLTVDAQAFFDSPTSETLAIFSEHHPDLFNRAALSDFLAEWCEHPEISDFKTSSVNQVSEIITAKINNSCMLGASGAVFGVLLAFGMMFPDLKLYIMFLPFGIKAKYFVMIYGALELIFGIFGTLDGIAHFAHLGGLLFGFLIIKYWQHSQKNY